MITVHFADIRDDWYRANQLVPRLVRKTVHGSDHVFHGFPRQWIPVFEYYGLAWSDCQSPKQHMPMVSEMSDRQLARCCREAKRQGTLRTMVESIVVLDPLLSDFLYILDNSVDFRPQVMERLPQVDLRCNVRLTNWQSYGRPEVRDFEDAVDQIDSNIEMATVLPCSRHRPYGQSRTHQRIWQALERMGYQPGTVHRIVVTSLGIIPEELWENPVVLDYDGGVPDIYRVLRLARRFFMRNRYREVLDCLEFPPYSDVLTILHNEKIIRKLNRGPVRLKRQFYLRP